MNLGNLNIEFGIICLTTLISLVGYSYLFILLNRKNFWNNSRDENELNIYLQRCAGFLLFGVLPVVVLYYMHRITIHEFGILLLLPQKTVFWFVVLSGIVLPVSIYNSKSPQNLAKYPQIRNHNWNIRILLLSTFTWIAYLLAYEFFFRGILLFSCIRMLGVTMAIVVNVIIYSLAHIPKGKLEVLGAIPFGIVLCLVTIYTGSFWTAFGTHVIMAISSEWSSLYFNKDIQFKSL